MIQAGNLITLLRDKGIRFFTGVPDSCLKSLCTALLQYDGVIEHVVAANEGNCMGLAVGNFLATGRPAVVYMQNSGLGNAVNPIASLLAREVYSVPALLIIGWRGAPGTKDEPQHALQGKITLELLETLNIPYQILDEDSDPAAIVDMLYATMMERGAPVALVVRKGTFAPEAGSAGGNAALIQREQALNTILDALPCHCACFATTGKTGRELFALREKRGEPQKDFLTVGGMGHASSIALGAALATAKPVVCLDGDGAFLMHMGAASLVGNRKPANFIHVILNNGCHESVGGQPTCAPDSDFVQIGKACGYATCVHAACEDEVQKALARAAVTPGPHLIEILVKPGSRSDLGRPSIPPVENKRNIMEHLQSNVMEAL